MDPRRDSSRWWQALEPERDADGTRFWDVKPGRFYLGVLAQRITLPLDLAGTLTGCSSEARCGYVPHQQAGHFDPGWDGYGTLELTFLAAPSLLFVGQRIAQMKFELLDEPVAFEDGYAGRYQGDQDAQPARLKVLTAA
jgi:deoxycytidine triphosphate deaminase